MGKAVRKNSDDFRGNRHNWCGDTTVFLSLCAGCGKTEQDYLALILQQAARTGCSVIL